MNNLKFQRILPDTSILIEGILSEALNQKTIQCQTIIIPEAAISELENQANKGRPTGHHGLQEIETLQRICNERDIELTVSGQRPGDFQIKNAKGGEIDHMIRTLSQKENATLLTADKVQADVAKAKGQNVHFYEIKPDQTKLPIRDYFDDTTMSVHLKNNTTPKAKKGTPESWTQEALTDHKKSAEEIKQMIDEITDQAQTRSNAFIENRSNGTGVIQFDDLRIIYTTPPASDDYEITAVKQVKDADIDNYTISDQLKHRLLNESEGIIISGAPGQGKTTFAQSLVQEYVTQGLTVKTLENPRDMKVPKEVTRYNAAKTGTREIFDVLLLGRPDKTVFDEIRDVQDFDLFSDLRLAGIGMTGVIHAHKPLDTVHRFLTKLELGLIPQVVDTIVFIENGDVAAVYSLSIEVKTPIGMEESDLSRPVVNIQDFESEKLLYEIYSYGDQIMVVPVENKESEKPVLALASAKLENDFSTYDENVSVRFQSDSRATVRMRSEALRSFIGEDGQNIDKLEEDYGINLHVEESSPLEDDDKDVIPHNIELKKGNVVFSTDEESTFVDIYVRNDFLMSAKTSKKGEIKISQDNNFGTILTRNIKEDKKIVLKA